jgi:hypothetical protein
MTNNDKLVDAYREAVGDYEAAKAGVGNALRRLPGFWWQRGSSRPVWGGLIRTWRNSRTAIRYNRTTPSAAATSNKKSRRYARRPAQ